MIEVLMRIKRKATEIIRYLKNMLSKNYINKYVNKKVLIFFVFILIFMSVYLTLGNSREQVIEQLAVGLANGDAKVTRKCVEIDDDNIGKKEIQPLLDYYKGKEHEVARIINELKYNDISSIFSVRSRKRMWKEYYYINVNSINGDLRSNIGEASFLLGGKRYKSDEKLTNIVPGKYKVMYMLETDFGNISGEEEVELIHNADIDVNIPATYITLNSETTDAKVYINDAYTGKKVSDFKEFGPLPTELGLEMYIEKEYPWGKIKSEIIHIKEEKFITININMVNDTLSANIDDVINQFFTSVFDALNKRDKDLIMCTSDIVKSKVYDDLNEKYFILKNNYEISDLEVNIEKSDFKYSEEKYKASIVTEINYSTYKKMLPFSKKDNSQTFLIQLEYKSGQWLVDDIQRFTIE